jgi:hypothetical protein
MFATLAALAVLSVAAQAQPEGPISTRTAAAEETGEQLARREARAYAAPLPLEAPTDDVAFVGWCLGRVAGHLETGKFLKDDDKELLALAETERRRFEDALAAAARRDPASVKAAREAQAKVEATWAEVRNKERVWAKMQYETFSGLPGRCEHAARRVAANIRSPAAELPPSEAAALQAAYAARPEPAPDAPVQTRKPR